MQLSILYLLIIFLLEAFSLPSDFFLDIPGISLNALILHACALEKLPGVDMGGKAVCWGEEDSNYNNINSIQDVIRYSINYIYSFKIIKTYFVIYKLQDIFIQVITTQRFSCGLNVEGRVLCWGTLLV